MKKQELYMLSNKRIFFLAFLFISFCSFNTFAQDSIPEKKDLTEESDLKFQQYFFKALSDKAIGNYSRAIENLENCNQILEENEIVFFEFSKNYLALNKTFLAKEYIKRALEKEPSNIWMLKHLVNVYVKEKNYNQAIETQQSVVNLNAKEREYLVRLFLYNRDYENALELIYTLESEQALSQSLKSVKENLEKRGFTERKVTLLSKETSLIAQFEKEKSYTSLENLLKKYQNEPDTLFKYSNIGLELFPSQPFLYLIKGKYLNSKKEYAKALDTLKNGIDFVLEDTMEIDFFKEIAKAYKGLGNGKEENYYNQKIKKLRG